MKNIDLVTPGLQICSPGVTRSMFFIFHLPGPSSCESSSSSSPSVVVALPVRRLCPRPEICFDFFSIVDWISFSIVDWISFPQQPPSLAEEILRKQRVNAMRRDRSGSQVDEFRKFLQKRFGRIVVAWMHIDVDSSGKVVLGRDELLAQFVDHSTS